MCFGPPQVVPVVARKSLIWKSLYYYHTENIIVADFSVEDQKHSHYGINRGGKRTVTRWRNSHIGEDVQRELNKEEHSDRTKVVFLRKKAYCGEEDRKHVVGYLFNNFFSQPENFQRYGVNVVVRCRNCMQPVLLPDFSDYTSEAIHLFPYVSLNSCADEETLCELVLDPENFPPQVKLRFNWKASAFLLEKDKEAVSSETPV